MTDEERQRCDAVIDRLFHGRHHVDRYVYDETGVFVQCKSHSCLSTFDFNQLTRFVLLCHKYCVRGEISPCMRDLRIRIHPRDKNGKNIYSRHPDLLELISQAQELQKEDEVSCDICGDTGFEPVYVRNGEIFQNVCKCVKNQVKDETK